MQPSGRANGMNFDAQGRLVVCCDGKDGGARAVQRFEADGTVTTLASHYAGKRLNAPNDLCFDSRGRIYFTDPRYGYKHDLEQDCMAVYRIEFDGTVTRVIDDLETPNGILITPDDRTLYLVDHNPRSGRCAHAGGLHDRRMATCGDKTVCWPTSATAMAATAWSSMWKATST